jgi:DNA-binding NtrC family response regulator
MNTFKLPERNGPTKVLIVDDDIDMINILDNTIRTRFHESIYLQSTTDPREACALLDAGLFDVLITDLQMPVINGLQLLRYAKSRNAWTQVIVVTGHSGTDELTLAMDLGASDYLTKPLDAEVLECCLSETLLRLNRWRKSLRNTLTCAN